MENSIDKVINLKCLCGIAEVPYYKAVNDFKRQKEHRNLTDEEKESLSNKLDQAVSSYKEKFLS